MRAQKYLKFRSTAQLVLHEVTRKCDIEADMKYFKQMFSSSRALEGSVAFFLGGQRAKHSSHSTYHMNVCFFHSPDVSISRSSAAKRTCPDSLANFYRPRHNRPSLPSVTPNGSGWRGPGLLRQKFSGKEMTASRSGVSGEGGVRRRRRRRCREKPRKPAS